MADSSRQHRHQQGDAVERGRDRSKVILPHPAGGEGYERHPEQQVDVSPQHPAIDMANQVKEMMVGVPIDRYVDETQHIAEKNRYYRAQGTEAGILWHLHLQYHDSDD